MSEKLYQQIECEQMNNDAPTSTLIVVWAEAKAKAGNIVTFKETGDLRWRVMKTYGVPVELTLNRGWGLDLPKSQRTER